MPKKRLRHYAAITGLTLGLTASLCACSSNGSPTAAKSGPIKIMAIFDLSNTGGTEQKYANTVVAAADAQNAAGGIRGRKAEVIVCDSQLSPNGAAACGREAVADGVIATVGFASSAAYYASTTPAHITDFNSLVAPEMLTASNSFTFWGGALAATSGLASAGRAAHCKKIAWVTSYVPPADRASQSAAFAATAKASGETPENPVYPVTGSPDMSPFTEDAISEGINCAAVQGNGADLVSIIKAFHQESPSVKIIVNTAFLAGNESALGSLMSGLVIVDVADESTDTSNPVVREWVSDIRKYSPSPKAYDSTGGCAWAEAELAFYAAGHVSDPTAANVESYISHLRSYNPGLLPAVNFTHPYPTSVGTRVFSPTMRLATYNNGNYYDTGPFLNVFTGKPWSPSSS